DGAVTEDPVEAAGVDVVHPVEGPRDRATDPALNGVGAKPPETEEWGHSARDEEAGDEGEGDREREGYEPVLGHARGDNNRKEDDDRRDGAHEDRHRHLLCRVEDGLLSIGGRLEVPVDVLELDDRVVDQAPDAEGQATKGEDVDRLSREIEKDERRDDR